MFIIIVFLLGSCRPSGLRFFVPALLLSILTPLFLPTSSVFFSYYVHPCSVARHKCLGKHSCMSFPFPIAILNGTCFFSTVQLQVYNENSMRYDRNADALVIVNT